MNTEEAKLYLEHTSKDDFNLEEHQKENRYQAIQVVLKEIERLNNIIKEVREYIKNHREAVDERAGHIIYILKDDFDEEDILKILDKENI